MITPRRTRLLRAAGLDGFRAQLAQLVRAAPAGADSFLLVPTAAAGEQLRRTLRARLGDAVAMPPIGTRAELYERLLARMPDARTLSGFEREALIAAAAREAEEAGVPPPFHVRPALIAEMLALYDYLRRLQRTVDDFDRLLTGELEPAADSDQGAAQLLEQTRFLAATFRGYEARLRDTGLLDEHAARELLIATPAAVPLRHVVITVGDRPLDPDGLWPADVVMLTSIAGLDAIDVVATDATLEAGYLDRLRLAFVGIEETESSLPAPPPAIVVPAGTLRLALGARSGQAAGELPFALEYRDREEELEGVARRLKADRRSGRHVNLEQTALVVARPLPYLYLARDVFQGAGVPFEALDTLPLAAEPYAAAVDVAMECVAAGFTRRALVALLRSPHFRFVAGDAGAVSGAVDVGRDMVAALDVRLAEQRYLGGLDRLASLADACRGTAQPAFDAALAAGTLLSPLGESHPMVEHVDLLRAFLDRHDRPQPGNDRRDRVRAAVALALAGLGEAYRRHDPGASGTITDLSAAVRRWLGAQTFALRTGEGGLQIVDRQAARFADFDDVQVMGLVEGEWPERPRRNIFYPQSLLAQLEPARPDRVALHQERDLVRFARASFRDLLMSARRRVRVSTFALESDAVVEPSAFLDDLPSLGLSREVSTLDPSVQVFTYEALAALNQRDAVGPTVGPHFSGAVVRWARVRAGGAGRERARFEGEAGPWVLPRVSVSRLERYLKCPFQFYVTNVLQVDEEPEDENTRSPLVRGRFLHELFETFFHEWQARGRGRITAADMAEARALFVEICEPALASLSPAEAGLERARLYGSAVGSGIAERVFAMEAERGTAIRERLMEFELDGEFTFTGEDGASRTVRLRAKIDRVDVLADGTFRVIDYKTKYVPDRRIALQLPIYSAGVRARLSAERGAGFTASEAMYLSFEGPQAVMALKETGKSFDELVTAAEHRLVQALDDIAAGHYPPRPETRNLCGMCAFVAVCRTPGGLPAEPGGHDE
ncbi:MAG: PD-(D/E)XK nuclease family protein [Acidobacteriota bacterium]|nr:PD-(D/E)XK nuclease family protein [Acidobacteriota bacterium]